TRSPAPPRVDRAEECGWSAAGPLRGAARHPRLLGPPARARSSRPHRPLQALHPRVRLDDAASAAADAHLRRGVLIRLSRDVSALRNIFPPRVRRLELFFADGRECDGFGELERCADETRAR